MEPIAQAAMADKSRHAVMDFDNAAAIIPVFRLLTSSLLLTGVYVVFRCGHQTVFHQ